VRTLALIGFSMLKEKILYGNKRQTIRKLRKTPIKRGERLHLYYHLRQRDCESLGSWTCTEVFYIRMFSLSHVIEAVDLVGECGLIVLHHTMTEEEVLNLAKRDGFNTTEELFTALDKMHGSQNGKQIFQVIRW